MMYFLGPASSSEDSRGRSRATCLTSFGRRWALFWARKRLTSMCPPVTAFFKGYLPHLSTCMTLALASTSSSTASRFPSLRRACTVSADATGP